MNPTQYSTAASSFPATSLASSSLPKHACHLVWDIESVAIPEGVSEVYVVNSLQALVEKECQGFLESFVVICKDGRLPFETKRGLQECGVVVEEINSPKSDIADIFILTRLLGLALSISAQPPHLARPILILISSDRDFARALSLLRRSGLFREVVLLHNADASEAVKSSATQPIDWRLFLNLAATRPKSPSTFPAVQTGRPTSVSAPTPPTSPTPSAWTQPPTRLRSLSQAPPPAPSASTAVAAPPKLEGILSLYGDKATSVKREEVVPARPAAEPQDWRLRKQDDKKKPPSATENWRSDSKPEADERRSRPASTAAGSTAGALGQGAGHYRPPHQREVRPTPTPSTGTAPAASAAPASVWVASLTPPQDTREFIKDTKPESTASDSDQRATSAQAETARGPAQTASPAKNGDKNRRPDKQTLACRLFGHVMGVCAEEKIIPRESVIRSKLEDTGIWDVKRSLCPTGLRSWPSLHMEFETWLETVISLKICVCVGVAPQRVLWPAPPAARFECADYFRPQERLTSDQMTALIDFLSHDRPSGHEVDRGRYGFANYLKTYGPPFVREMPRGYVVELVQLLLNKNFLQFRKGKVSFRLALESVLAPGSSRLDYGADAMPDEGDVSDDTGSDAESTKLTTSPPASPGLSLSSRPSARDLIEQQMARRNSVPTRSGNGDAVRTVRSGSLPDSKRPRSATTSSLDLEDPVEVLAVKCAETLPPGSDLSALGLGMGALASKTVPGKHKSQPVFPLYHFEKSGEQHAPLWVCVVTLDNHPTSSATPPSFLFSAVYLPPSKQDKAPLTAEELPPSLRPKRFRSTKKAKKLEAQQESALRALESTFWEEPIPEEFHTIDKTKMTSGVLDDPVAVLDRLLVALEQAPVVYSMDSTITQHGSGSRTLWSCGVQLTLRPRPAQLTTGTLAPEEAHSDVTKEVPEDVPSVRYPTIKWTASHSKKFDAKAIVAAHILQLLEKSQHRYPLLFQPASEGSKSAPATPMTAAPSTPPTQPAPASPLAPGARSFSSVVASKPVGRVWAAKAASAPTSPLMLPARSPALPQPVPLVPSSPLQPDQGDKIEGRERVSSIPGGPSTRPIAPLSPRSSPLLQPTPSQFASVLTSPLLQPVNAPLTPPMNSMASESDMPLPEPSKTPVQPLHSPELGFNPLALMDELENSLEAHTTHIPAPVPARWGASLHELAQQAGEAASEVDAQPQPDHVEEGVPLREGTSQSSSDEDPKAEELLKSSCLCV